MRRSHSLAVMAIIAASTGCEPSAVAPPPAPTTSPAPEVRAPADRVDIPIQVNARTLLVSEIAAAAHPESLLDCPITVTNHTSTDQQLTLVGTGCSCYGVTFDGQPLESGKPIPLSPEQSLRLNVQAHIIPQDDDREFEIMLQATQPDEPASQTDVACRLKVYSDVGMSPRVVSWKGRKGAPLQENRTVQLEHVYRAAAAREVTLQPQGLPAILKLDEISLAGPAEQLEAGLWMQKWNAVLKLDVPAEQELAAPVIAFDLVAESPGVPPQRGQAQAVVELTKPLSYFPKLQFGAISVGESRQRRILISANDRVPFELKLATQTLPAGLTVSVANDAQPRHWLEVTLATSAPGEIKEELKFKTSLPEEPEVVIAVEATVLPASEPESPAPGG